MWELLPVLLEHVDAADIADPVRQPGAHEVGQLEPNVDREQAVLAFDTLKPANNIVASLGIGMQALLEEHEHEDPGQAHRVDHVDGEVHDRVRQSASGSTERSRVA